MQTIQVLLIGGRQIPNFLGVHLLLPDAVELVVSTKEKPETVERLLEALKGIPGLNLPDLSQGLRALDAADFQSNQARCREICGNHPQANIHFNLTCSHKIAALAAYETAKEFAPRAEAFYVETESGRLLWPVGRKDREVKIRISIEQYLSTYGRTPQYKNCMEKLTFGEKSAIPAADFLSQDDEAVRSTLGFFKRVDEKKKKRLSLESMENSQKEVVRRLAQMEIVDLEEGERLTIRAQQDLFFLKGDWLEIYVCDQARQQKNKSDASLFDECCQGLKIPCDKAVKEIDVALLYQAQMILCSCKTNDDPFKVLFLDELSSVSNLVGNRYCSRVFVTHVPSQNMPARKMEEFMQQAKQREIVLVTGENLKDIGQILAGQATKPTYARA
jgi:hypothetical protein